MSKFNIQFKFTNRCRRKVMANSEEEAREAFLQNPWENWSISDIYSASTNEIISVNPMNTAPQEYTIEYEFSPICEIELEADSVEKAIELFNEEHSKDTEWEIDSTSPTITKITPVKRN